MVGVSQQLETFALRDKGLRRESVSDKVETPSAVPPAGRNKCPGRLNALTRGRYGLTRADGPPRGQRHPPARLDNRSSALWSAKCGDAFSFRVALWQRLNASIMSITRSVTCTLWFTNSSHYTCCTNNELSNVWYSYLWSVIGVGHFLYTFSPLSNPQLPLLNSKKR